MNIFLVKPHPPSEILEGKCPITENFKYNWEPIALKLIAHRLQAHFKAKVNIVIWHLTSYQDDETFLSAVEDNQPQLVAFSEIDILVNEVNRLSKKIKSISAKTKIIVGGKQSSLLRKGDKSPFLYADFAIRGDGVNGIDQYVDYILSHKKELEEIDGMILWDKSQTIYSENRFSSRTCEDIDHLELHKIKVHNHDLKEYIYNFQNQASITESKVLTSPIYTGQGCPFNCHFCQSPMEHGKMGRVFQTLPQRVAAEIHWLNQNYSVNNFFSLEPNVDLNNLLCIYEELEKYNLYYISISGFIRPADVVKAEKSNLLKHLVKKGMRILYIGLDVPLNCKEDIFNKNFSYKEMMECIQICRQHGIIVISTMLGSPDLTKEEFDQLLKNALAIPVAEIEVRLAIALRNTKYYETCSKFLIHDPNSDFKYYDKQNYRYQTLQYPEKIKPDETYSMVNQFNKDFYFTKEHLNYVSEMIKQFPDTIPYFKRLYDIKLKNFPDMQEKIQDLLHSKEEVNQCIM